MNILIINHYAGSPKHGMEYRHYYLAREWVRLGHKVSIAAASYSHLRSVGPKMTGNTTEEKIDGIRYLWLRTPRYRGNGIGRVMNMSAFGLMLVMLKAKIAGLGKPDLVIASSPHPFIIYGARKIARAAKAKLMFEVRDLWPLTLTELGGMSPRHPFISAMQWMENYAYDVSDKVISLLPKADGYMISHGMAPNNFVCVPNGIEAAEWGPDKSPLPQQHDSVLGTLKNEGRFIVGYAGAHGISNSLDILMAAAALLQSHAVTFVLVGQGPEKKTLQDRARAMGLNNVEFLPPVTKAAVPKLLSEMDTLFIGWKKQPLYRFGISPNKLMDYMMASKPVIHAIEAGNDPVAESGCGFSIPPEDPDAIKETLLKLIYMTDDERKDMGARGKKYVLAHHDYRVLAKRYLEAFEREA